ncbi:MAG: hypothetical protein HY776_00755 [Actinobacteria bacterium]|nr:hypothetical protein [Actinomycetota bacterium]
MFCFFIEEIVKISIVKKEHFVKIMKNWEIMEIVVLIKYNGLNNNKS